jgi:hypothetical protein
VVDVGRAAAVRKGSLSVTLVQSCFGKANLDRARGRVQRKLDRTDGEELGLSLAIDLADQVILITGGLAG